MCAVTTIQDEGVTQTTTATTLNFTGTGVKASGSGATSTIAIPSSVIDAKRDFGAVGNGTTDDTTALQNAVNASGTQRVPLVIPAGQYKVSARIDITSNVVIFGYGARVLSYSAVAGVAGVPVVIVGQTGTPIANVKIYGLEIDGRKASQPDAQACFLIQGNVQNVLVKDCYFHDATGDGWYTLESSVSASYVPTNLVFEDVVCIGNKRQGASICCGRFVTVRGGTYSNTGGRPPGAGIDIEPSLPTAPCEYIVIDGVRFANNAGPGLLMDFAVPGASPVRYISVMNCHMLSNSENGITIRGIQDVHLVNNVVSSNGWAGLELMSYPSSPVRDIVVENSRFTSNATRGVLCVVETLASAKTLKFTDLVVVDNGTSNPDNFAGMQFQGPIDDIQVIGCTSQNRGTSNQAYGLITGAGVTRFRADLNNFDGNASLSVVLGDDPTTRRYGANNND